MSRSQAKNTDPQKPRTDKSNASYFEMCKVLCSEHMKHMRSFSMSLLPTELSNVVHPPKSQYCSLYQACLRKFDVSHFDNI